MDISIQVSDLSFIIVCVIIAIKVFPYSVFKRNK